MASNTTKVFGKKSSVKFKLVQRVRNDPILGLVSENEFVPCEKNPRGQQNKKIVRELQGSYVFTAENATEENIDELLQRKQEYDEGKEEEEEEVVEGKVRRKQLTDGDKTFGLQTSSSKTTFRMVSRPSNLPQNDNDEEYYEEEEEEEEEEEMEEEIPPEEEDGDVSPVDINVNQWKKSTTTTTTTTSISSTTVVSTSSVRGRGVEKQKEVMDFKNDIKNNNGKSHHRPLTYQEKIDKEFEKMVPEYDDKYIGSLEKESNPSNSLNNNNNNNQKIYHVDDDPTLVTSMMLATTNNLDLKKKNKKINQNNNKNNNHDKQTTMKCRDENVTTSSKEEEAAVIEDMLTNPDYQYDGYTLSLLDNNSKNIVAADKQQEILQQFEHAHGDIILENGSFDMKKVIPKDEIVNIILQRKLYEEEQRKHDNDEEEEEEEDILAPYLKEKEKEEYDCESILSTYTNTENHPKLIDDEEEEEDHQKHLPLSDASSHSHKVIELSKKNGIPLGVLHTSSSSSSSSNPSKSILESQNSSSLNGNDNKIDQKMMMSSSSNNNGKKRQGMTTGKINQDETTEQRKQRKKQFKELKKINRQEKKQMKQVFKKEELKQSMFLVQNQQSLSSLPKMKVVIKY